MQIKILDEAEDDIAHGIYFYQSQKEGLGNYFLGSIMPNAVLDCRKNPSWIKQRLENPSLKED